MRDFMHLLLLPLGLLPLGLGGCAGQASGTLGSVVSGAVSAVGNGGSLTPVENLTDEFTLQKLQSAHNLLIGAQQILAAPGPVSVMTPPSTVVMPAPVTPAPVTPVTPAPTGTVPTGPTNNG